MLVDKPAGLSSFGVVAKTCDIWRAELRKNGLSPKLAKVGHCGTLDPFATGLLILVLGGYTKRAAEFSGLDKTYLVNMRLGQTSTTGDPEGEIAQKSDKKPTEHEIRAVLKGFEGEIMQKPHKYSAVKIGGQRAYKLARAGQEVETEPRKVTIYQLQATSYQYPELCITARVSSGTYIRSLVEDIGRRTGSGAYATDLRRVRVGPFDAKDAILFSQLDFAALQSALQTSVAVIE